MKILKNNGKCYGSQSLKFPEQLEDLSGSLYDIVVNNIPSVSFL